MTAAKPVERPLLETAAGGGCRPASNSVLKCTGVHNDGWGEREREREHLCNPKGKLKCYSSHLT